MVTLQQIYDKLTGHLGVVGVAQTGQTNCWNASGTMIACAGTGQDGAFQRGFSASPRFTDNADGTVKDNLTGLIWLKNANCFGLQTWTNALSAANTLASGACSLTDGSAAGDWRLPNIRELQSLIDYAYVSPALPGGHPFSGVQAVQGGYYWSSTTAAFNPSGAWMVSLTVGDVGVDPGGKAGNFSMWPVRGGQ
jgi:hypothetical protein